MARGPNSEMAKNRGRCGTPPAPQTPAHSATRAPARPPTRDERRQRQAREAVAGEKALAGEVTVAVEVGLQQSVDVGEQVHLLLGLGRRRLARAGRRRFVRIARDLVLILLLAERAAVQTAPAITRPGRSGAPPVPGPVQPTVTVPIGFLELVPTTVEINAARTRAFSKGALASTAARTCSCRTRVGSSPSGRAAQPTDCPATTRSPPATRRVGRG